MIEVEKKFILTKKQEDNLIKDAEFVGEVENTDIYYDDLNYSLTKQDLWLRNRNGRFELKVPMNGFKNNHELDRYRELETEEEILDYFKSDFDTVKEFLKDKEYNSFCTIVTKRRKYKKEGFNIDLDVADFGYTLGEVEFLTSDELSLEDVTKSIFDFAKRHDLEIVNVYGKVEEYLRRNNLEHFDILVNLGIIKTILE
jgi:adenylate cyclase class IV